jgi:hypothetical protein
MEQDHPNQNKPAKQAQKSYISFVWLTTSFPSKPKKENKRKKGWGTRLIRKAESSREFAFKRRKAFRKEWRNGGGVS